MDAAKEIASFGNKFHILRDKLKKFFGGFMEPANDENELKIPLRKETGTNLQDLNEDCLLEIFSDESLSVMDLCSLAESCTRFQQIVRRVFPTTLRIINPCEDNTYSVESGKYSSIENRTEKLRGCEDIEIILRNVTSNLTEIIIESRITSNEKSPFQLNLVSKYCVESMDSLDIICMENTEEALTVKSEEIFNRRLQLLVLFNIDIMGGFDTFIVFESLIELIVYDVKGYKSILKMTFPKLERFTLIDNQINDYISLEAFILRHPMLKTLFIDVNLTEKNRNLLVQLIGNSCKKLEKLRLSIVHGDELSLLPLQSLKSLKKLETLNLWGVACRDLSFVPAMTNLRELILTKCCPPHGDHLPYLTQLTKLHIADDKHTVNVVDVITKLVNLEEFLVRFFRLDKETFSEIVRIVKGRPNVLTLLCRFEFSYNSKNCEESQNVRLVKL